MVFGAYITYDNRISQNIWHYSKCLAYTKDVNDFKEEIPEKRGDWRTKGGERKIREYVVHSTEYKI